MTDYLIHGIHCWNLLPKIIIIIWYTYNNLYGQYNYRRDEVYNFKLFKKKHLPITSNLKNITIRYTYKAIGSYVYLPIPYNLKYIHELNTICGLIILFVGLTEFLDLHTIIWESFVLLLNLSPWLFFRSSIIKISL